MAFALRSSALMMTLRPILSFFTLFQTHSSGLRSGKDGGRKNMLRRPSAFPPLHAVAQPLALCTGWPSTMRKIFPGTLSSSAFRKSINFPAFIVPS